MRHYSDDPFSPTAEEWLEAIDWLGSPRMDVGCGPNPLPYSDVYVDLLDWYNPKITQMDFYTEPLPTGFNIYCRHVLEDMRYPEILLEQFQRCERGWIETPHPSVEHTRKMDLNYPWRGFAHHWWYIWVEGDTLVFCPKSIASDHLPDLGPIRKWNTVYKWRDYGLKWKILKHDIDFDTRKSSYFDTLKRGYNA